LFDRNNRSVVLTKYGQIFLKHASIALAQLQKGIGELQNISKLDEDKISIASTYCIGTYFMPFVISGFLSLNPDSKFQFSHEATTDILKNLKDGKISLGFYEKLDDIQNHNEIESVEVKREEYVLIVPKNHKLANEKEVSLKELKDEAFIVYCDENKDKMVSYSEFIDYTPKISIRPSEASMLGGLVAAGAGITIVPKTPLINTNAVATINIKEDIGYKTIYMGWLKNSDLSPAAASFRDYVISLI